MKKLLVATKNPGKLAELSEFLSDLPLEIVSLTDVGIEDDVEEDGKTYKENSVKKATFYAKKSGLPTISDDGGLEIDALNGEPGVRSRRWLGYEASDEVLTTHMISVSKKLPQDNRKAFFRTVVSFALPVRRKAPQGKPTVKVWSISGEVEGVIAEKPHLKHLKGYPYRSFFFLPEINKFYHENELTPQEMKKYNHRYRAISKLKPIIKQELGIMK